MTDRDALLDAVIREPLADAPRLVYADWLDEHGDAADRGRAEFIRVQIELARRPADDPHRPELRQRMFELMYAHLRRWEAALAVLPAAIGWGEYRRGFIDAVSDTVVPGLLPAVGGLLSAVAAGPHLEIVRPDDETLDWLAADPRSARLTHLGLSVVRWSDTPSPPVSVAAITRLGNSPHLTALRGLWVQGVPLGPAGVEALAATPLAGRLEVVQLDGIEGAATELARLFWGREPEPVESHSLFCPTVPAGFYRGQYRRVSFR
jgi:uncharacterized protein (TIGR02996 family)